jgi:DNA-binding MarR family transcriptional regulator
MEKRFALDEMACFQAYRLHHAFGRYYQAAFAGTGYTYAKYLVIKALQEHGKMSLSELAAQLGVEPNTLSPLVKKMATFEMVERLRDPEDERRILLQRTPRGVTALQEADAIVADHFAALDITEEELSQTIKWIASLRSALESAADGSNPKLVAG